MRAEAHRSRLFEPVGRLSMDVLRAKEPGCRWATWPDQGDRVALAALSPAAAVRADRAADAWLEAHGTRDEGLLELERCCQVVASAAGLPVEVVRERAPEAVLAVYGAWESHQDAALPEPLALQEALRRGVLRDNHIQWDGLAAYHAETPAAYYGRPVAELTLGQLCYYLSLSAAYEEAYGPESGDRMVSREWLEQN